MSLVSGVFWREIQVSAVVRKGTVRPCKQQVRKSKTGEVGGKPASKHRFGAIAETVGRARGAERALGVGAWAAWTSTTTFVGLDWVACCAVLWWGVEAMRRRTHGRGAEPWQSEESVEH